MIRERWTAIAVVTSMGSLLAGCQSTTPTPAQLESMQTVSDAYYAYQKEDCRTVLRLTNPAGLESWEYSEMRYSMLLLNGFCLELEGERDQARTAYENLVAISPRSFSAQDAQERLRIMTIEDEDPDHARWIREAGQRADPTTPTRIPIDRVPAQYPPLARTTGVEGYAVVEFGVSARGETEEPVIVESHPPYLFDASALRAVREWEFSRKPDADPKDRQLIRIVFKRGELPESSAEPQASEPIEP
jgi:TonB family protein